MDNKIHETAIIGENVTIGKGNIIGAYTVIYDNVEIGDNNTIGSFVVIGGDGETKRETEFTKKIIICDNNLINHHVTVDRGNERDTIIGDYCYIMTKAHLGHDVQLENNVTISSGANIGGHVTIEQYANVGLNAEVHQRLRIGQSAMVGMGSSITKPVYPFMKVVGVNRILGYNVKRVKASGLDMREIRIIGREFKVK